MEGYFLQGAKMIVSKDNLGWIHCTPMYWLINEFREKKQTNKKQHVSGKGGEKKAEYRRGESNQMKRKISFDFFFHLVAESWQEFSEIYHEHK